MLTITPIVFILYASAAPLTLALLRPLGNQPSRYASKAHTGDGCRPPLQKPAAPVFRSGGFRVKGTHQADTLKTEGH